MEFRGLPAHDTGLPLLPVEKLLADQGELLERLKLAYGCDEATYRREILGVVENYARFVHLLPATPDNFFKEPGGLFRMGVEIAFFALQGADGHIFEGRQTISQRMHLEPRWRYATFLAGLLSEVHRAIWQVVVTGTEGQDWPAYLGPLSSWAASQKLARYFVRWIPRSVETRATGLFALPHIVPAQTLQWLSERNTSIVPDMLAAVGGLVTYRDPNLIDKLVRRCIALVIDRHLQSSADRYGKPMHGAHLERYLVDAMRRLVAGGAWTVNGERSRLWYGEDGLFLVWPNSANDVVKLLVEKDQLAGIPKSPETLAEILSAAGVFLPRDDNELLWEILPPGSGNPVSAVKIGAEKMLLSALDTKPPRIPQRLIHVPGSGLPGASAEGARTGTASRASPGAQLSLLPGTEVATVHPRSAAASMPDENARALAAGKASPPAAPPTGQSLPSTPASEPCPARFELRAAIRLHPTVKNALADIVDSMNRRDGDAACCTIPWGLFVPLSQLEARQLDPGVATRALADSGMLVTPVADSKTYRHSFGSARDAPGVVIGPSFVGGLDPAHFDAP